MIDEKQFLCVDLETTSIKVEDAIIKVFGAYDPLEHKFFIYKWNDESLVKVMQLFETYQFLVTFNGIKYDMPLLEKHGVPIKNYKHIDVYNIIRYKRLSLIRPKGFKSYSMRNLLTELGLDTDGGKGEIDYEIFKKDYWTRAEQDAIVEYLKRDLLGTWKLFKFLLDRFNPLTKYLPPKDAALYKHLTISLPTYVYKVLCHITGVRELYDESPRVTNNPLLITTFPRKEKVTNAVLLKFNNLYAHTIMQFNLLSYNCKCCFANEGKFHGRNYYIINGYYCQRSLGIIEKFLKDLQRASDHDADAQFLRNIIFSQLYTVVGNALYYSIFDNSVAKDTVAIVKHQLSAMSRMFEEEGYFVINIDVDNVFISVDESKGQSVEDLLLVKDEIITFLQSKMPFKSETFDLKFKYKLQYLQFVKKDSPEGSPQNFMKKGEYVYVTEEGYVGSKGLGDDDVDRMLSGVLV